MFKPRHIIMKMYVWDYNLIESKPEQITKINFIINQMLKDKIEKNKLKKI
jgi:hypothetical protein